MEGEGPIQTEGMWSTVLEYQAMPSLRGEANDGWLFTFTTVHSSWKFHQLTAGQPLSRQPVRYGKGGRYGPSITYKITHTGSLSSSPPGKPPCWASSTACYIVNVHNHPSWATHARKAWPGTLVDPCLLCDECKGMHAYWEALYSTLKNPYYHGYSLKHPCTFQWLIKARLLSRRFLIKRWSRNQGVRDSRARDNGKVRRQQQSCLNKKRTP